MFPAPLTRLPFSAPQLRGVVDPAGFKPFGAPQFGERAGGVDQIRVTAGDRVAEFNRRIRNAQQDRAYSLMKQ